MWVCAGERCPAQEVLGPDFLLIFVFIGSLYTEDTEILFVLAAGIQLGPLYPAVASCQVPCRAVADLTFHSLCACVCACWEGMGVVLLS